MKNSTRQLTRPDLAAVRGGKRTEVKDSHDRYANALPAGTTPPGTTK